MIIPRRCIIQKSTGLQTLSHYTLSLTKSSEAAANLGNAMNSGMSSVLTTLAGFCLQLYKTIELACMVLSAIPLIIMYPFRPEIFEKGVMVGSVKG